MNSKRKGKQSVVFPAKPRILASAAIVGDVESHGPLGEYFDYALEDDKWGEDSFEKAERKMFESAVRMAAAKVSINPEDLDVIIGGDLLNQLISSNFAARELKAPYLGLYGACSTMAESLLVASILIDGEYAKTAACTAGSHFSSAERQYRFPLELGGQKPPSAQRTVTGVGTCILASNECQIKSNGNAAIYDLVHIVGGTIGTVVDMGITDENNMGAAMAPAAASTLEAVLNDFSMTVDDFDLIITGDLGRLGTELLNDLCAKKGIMLKNKHLDCGNLIFAEQQNVDCGGSGCGCSAVTLSGYLLKQLEAGDFSRALFMATGALLSPTSTMQGDTIPAIAHAVILERGEK